MKLAADANVLLSAVIGGRAKVVLAHPQIEEVLTTQHTIAEIEEYALILAKRRRLRADFVLLAVAALPVTIVAPTAYSKSMAEALHRIGNRDPDDAELLALALHAQIPVWSNDRDFEQAKVDRFTTEDLLRNLRIIK